MSDEAPKDEVMGVVRRFGGLTEQFDAAQGRYVPVGVVGATNLCPCGRELHYSNPATRTKVENLIAVHGPLVEIALSEKKRTFLVPRHYIALHGLKASELPELAKKYGFEEVP